MAKVSLLKGDITNLHVDAIVSAASATLKMNSGVARAIRAAGGQLIEDQAAAQAPVAIGECVMTGAGKLSVKHVLHAVVAADTQVTDGRVIRIAARNALRLANLKHLKSVALPALGAGAGGFAVNEAARIVIDAIHDELDEKTTVKSIVLVADSDEAYLAFERHLKDARGEKMFFVENAVENDEHARLMKDLATDHLARVQDVLAVRGDVFFRENGWDFYAFVKALDSNTVWDALKPYNNYTKHRKVVPIITLEEWLNQDRFSL